MSLVLTFSSQWSSTLSSLWRMFIGSFQWWMFSQVYFQQAMVLPCCFWKDNLSKLDMVHTCFDTQWLVHQYGVQVIISYCFYPGINVCILQTDSCYNSAYRVSDYTVLLLDLGLDQVPIFHPYRQILQPYFKKWSLLPTFDSKKIVLFFTYSAHI